MQWSPFSVMGSRAAFAAWRLPRSPLSLYCGFQQKYPDAVDVGADSVDWVRQVLGERLAVVPGLTLVSWEVSDGGRGGHRVRIRHGGLEHLLVVVVSQCGQPRFLRRAIEELRVAASGSSDVVAVVAGPYISEQSARLCMESGVGYFDEAGNCCLQFGSVYIERGGRRNVRSSDRALRSLYSARASRVLRAMLLDTDAVWRLARLADRSCVSLGQAYNVKNRLVACGLAQSDGQGLRLSDPLTLLEDWAHVYKVDRSQFLLCNSADSQRDVELRLSHYCGARRIGYGFSGASVAKRLLASGEITGVCCYVQDDLRQVAHESGLTRGGKGAPVVLVKPYDQGVFFGARESDGLRAVSCVQVYLDLLALPNGDAGLARRLLHEIMVPGWQSR